MESGYLDSLYAMLNGSVPLAAFASFVWGVMSIVISPCHLSTIPLIIGFLQSKNVKPKQNINQSEKPSNGMNFFNKIDNYS